MPVTVVESHFKLTFLGVLALTVALMLADIVLSVMVGSPNEATQRAIDTCDSCTKAGVGALLGLLGGKAA
jgi:hypothetical protein